MTSAPTGQRAARGSSARPARPLLLAAAGILLGIGLAWGSLRVAAGVVRNGPWITDLATGSTAAGPITRARIAVAGLLALSNTEAIYFSADEDDAGRTLDGSCDYRVEGVDPGSAWWSITLYDADGYLLPNDAGRWSVSKTTVSPRPDGGFAVRVSPRGSGPDWLPSPASGRFNLTLRCYEPSAALRADPGAAALPRIVREDCR